MDSTTASINAFPNDVHFTLPFKCKFELLDMLTENELSLKTVTTIRRFE